MKHLDDAGHLIYKRVDVQMNPDKQYFLAVCLGNFSSPATSCDSASPYHFSGRDETTNVLYFSTANEDEGVKSEDELPEKWLHTFIAQNEDYIKRYKDSYPAVLKALNSSNISELAIKMGIEGI